MSFDALRLAGCVPDLTPMERLTLYQLAHHHNADTNLCNPSPGLLAAETGMTQWQVRRQLHSLMAKNRIARDRSSGWRFPDLHKDPAHAIPANWWPSDSAINRLMQAFPQHHFNLEEAVHDFIAFCHRRQLSIPPAERDSAFVRNISAILRLRRIGPTEINRPTDGNELSSVLDFLAQPHPVASDVMGGHEDV